MVSYVQVENRDANGNSHVVVLLETSLPERADRCYRSVVDAVFVATVAPANLQLHMEFMGGMQSIWSFRDGTSIIVSISHS